jgi:hypothetical protein
MTISLTFLVSIESLLRFDFDCRIASTKCALQYLFIDDGLVD